MSAITIDNDLVHYEVLGRGRPVILVHGWLGSWRYWVPAMQQLSTKYRVYAIDLWGFGDSGKDPTRYGLRDQVKLLHGFMEKLGVGKAALVGHSLGAAVCLLFARQFPELAPRMMLVSAPIWDMGGLDDDLSRPTTTNRPATVVNINPNTPKLSPDSLSAEARANATDATLPRNPIRERLQQAGITNVQSFEDILANIDKLDGRDTSNKQSTAQPASRPSPLPATGPLLPTNIAKPMTTSPATSSQTMPAVASSGVSSSGLRNDGGNPLLALLNNGDPVTLLMKYADRSSPDLDKLRAEVSKTDAAVLQKSVMSFAAYNIALELHKLTTPTLLLHGEDDQLIPAPSEEFLKRINSGKPLGAFLSFLEGGLRHFPMLEIAAKFNRLLMDFLEAPDLTNVQFKDTWTRTIR